MADPFAGSREQAAALLDGKVRLFEDHNELLKSGVVDAVVVASPNFTHVQVMRDAIATDLPILCEKPLVTRIADGVELIERAKNRKAMVWVAHEYRYMPPVAEMLKIADAGGVGTIHQVAIREHREPFYPKVGDWEPLLGQHRRHPGREMQPLLQPDGPDPEGEAHPRVCLRRPARQPPRRKYDGKTPDLLDSAFVIVEYPSGRARRSTCACSPRIRSTTRWSRSSAAKASSNRCCRRVCCVTAGAKTGAGARPGASRRGPARVWPVRQVRDTNLKYLGQHFGSSYVEHQRFAQAVRQGLPPDIPLEEGLRAVATGLAAHKSIDEGRVVAMSEVLPAGW